MATDATGTPTSNGIPTFQTNVDAPSGKGFNAAMAAIDTLITSALKTVITKAGAAVGTRRGINFIQGTGITLTVADNAGSDRVDVTVTNSGTLSVPPTFLGNTVFPTTTGALTANKPYFFPINFFGTGADFLTFGFKVASGGGTGHVDAGIYYTDNIGLSSNVAMTKVGNVGGVATPATGYAEITTPSPITFANNAFRKYYLAFICDSATPTFAGFNAYTPHLADSANASWYPLNATAVGTPATGAFHPHVYAYTQ